MNDSINILCRVESEGEGSELDEDGFDAASKAKKMRPDEDSVKAKKQLTVKFGFGKKKKGAAGKESGGGGLDASTKFQIAAASDPAEGGSGEQTKSKVNELLELEMRARAIKALLNKKPEGGEDEDGAEGAGGDDEAADEEEEEAAAEQKKAMEEQKRLQKAREALMVSEAKRREEDEIREKKQEEIRQRIEAEVTKWGISVHSVKLLGNK